MGCTGKFRPHHARDFEKTNSAGRKTKRHSKDAVIYEINSVVIARKLINDHGILPNKSALDLPYPNNIPDEFLSHFARGDTHCLRSCVSFAQGRLCLLHETLPPTETGAQGT